MVRGISSWPCAIGCVVAALAGGLAAGPALADETSAAQPIMTGDYTDTQWNLAATPLEALHALGHTGDGVTIAVLDGTFDATHPEIAANVVETFVVDGTTVRELPPQDMPVEDEHGTHVAGIAAAGSDGVGMTGVAPEASLILGTVVWSGAAEGVWPSVIAGLDHVAGRADVVNMSLGQPLEALEPSLQSRLCASVEAATAAGTLVVIAAGNSGLETNPPMLPAGCREAVTVTSLDPNLGLAFYSSYDGYVSLAAPGTDIVGPLARPLLVGSPFEVEPRPLIPLSGTSMAAPFVAGVAALVAQEFPDDTPDDLRMRLARSALDLGAEGFDPTFGYGMVDPAAALGEPSLPSPTPTAFPSYVSFTPVPKSDDVVDLGATWRPGGAGGEIEGYTLQILGYEGNQTWTLDDTSVRFLGTLELPAGWATLTAHTSAGSVTTPYQPITVGGGGNGLVKSITARWVKGNLLRVNWALNEPLESGRTITIEAVGQAPPGYAAMRIVEVDPQGQLTGSLTLDLAEGIPQASLARGVRQYAAGNIASVLGYVTGTFSGAGVDVVPRLPVNLIVNATGPRTGNLSVYLNPESATRCPDRGGQPQCRGLVVRAQALGIAYTGRMDIQGYAAFPIIRERHARWTVVDIAVPGLGLTRPLTIIAVTARFQEEPPGIG